MPDDLTLALALLEIAELAMPDTYFFSDSRCQKARKVLREYNQPCRTCQHSARLHPNKEHPTGCKAKGCDCYTYMGANRD